ncbi:FAD-dependent oxidoreductase [Streptomyces nogalater]
MAGLFAARVLSDAYTHVTVVDRDTLTGATEPRKGVPQGRQVHGLLASGHQVIEELFPGITDEMVRSGAHLGDLAGNLRWYVNGVRLRRSRTGVQALTSSRPFLERHVRERVEALPNVEFLERRDILRLCTTPGHDRVTGAVVARQDDGGAEETLTADLVVDTTGRGSRTPAWLAEFGYGQVEEERQKIGLGYTTCHYRMRSDPYRGDTAINIMASPPCPGAPSPRRSTETVPWSPPTASSATTRPPTTRVSSASSSRSPRRTSTRPSRTRSRCTPRWPTGSPSACAAATSGCPGSRRGCW